MYFKKIVLFSTLILLNFSLTAQNDSIKAKKFCNKGFYAIGKLNAENYWYGKYKNINSGSATFMDMDALAVLGLGIGYETKGAFAFSITTSTTKNIFYNGDSVAPSSSWSKAKDKLKMIEANCRMPLHKRKHRLGIFFETGISLEQLTGYFTSSNDENVASVFNKNSNFKITAYMIKAGFGAEFKFKYFQLFGGFRMQTGLSNLNNHSLRTNAYDISAGMRLKIPSIFKGTKDRYHWL